MQTTFSYFFYLKKQKDYSKGPISIFVRLTINSQRAEFSCGIKCHPDKWNFATGRPSGTNEDAKTISKYLDTIDRKLYETHRILLEKGKLITAQALKNAYLGKSEKPRSLVEIFTDHNSKIKELLGREYAAGTLERYKTSLKHTIEFLNWKFKVSDIDIRNINHAFITDYEFYLRSVRNCANNSTVKYIKNFGKIIRICIANGWLDKNPFANYKAKIKEVERVFLTNEELESISNKKFATVRVGQVRDIFIFSCYTGLAYADVKKLDNTQVLKGIDGSNWIVTNRQKTDTRSSIPILPKAQEILDKYAHNPQSLNSGKLLPVSSNQKMNEYLKEIADLCQISKPLTYHTARHTFATTVTLSNGVPIETVSKMLGHKSIKITQHYAKIVDSKISEDMVNLKQRLALKEQQKISEAV